MMQVLDAAIFAGAFGFSAATIAAMLAPQWQRIVALASGHREETFAPLRQLALAENRIAVRRWSAETMRPSREWRAAA